MREISTLGEVGNSENACHHQLLADCKSAKGLPELAKGEEDQKRFDQLGFPKVDITGFGQKVPYEASGISDAVRHRIGRFFTADESYDVKLKRSIEEHMTPEERKQYESEEKLLAQHKREVFEWGIQSTLNSEAYPKAPHCPMHEVVAKRVQQAQEAIGQEVRKSMSPDEQRKLDEQLKQYEVASRKVSAPKNPLGTEGFRPQPEPGPAIKDYYRRIGKATEDYLKRH